MYPKLVENRIKNIVNTNLRYCHDIKLKYYNFVYNICCFLFILSVIFIIFYIQYKNKQDVKSQREKENKKRDYIL